MKNDPEFMECPCMCHCGNWFDQTDGHSSKYRNSSWGNDLVCDDCHEKEEQRHELEEQILDVEIEIGNYNNVRKNKKFLKELQLKLNRL